jgi:hypothetical protein
MERAYLSIIEWPPGGDPAEQAQALAKAADMDQYQATMAIRRGFPQVVLRTDPPAAETAVERLHDLGVVALACRQEDLARFGAPRRVKRLVPTDDLLTHSYTCEMWRDAEVVLNMADVFLIVRATLAATQARTGVDGPSRGGAAGAVPGSRGAVRLSAASSTEMLDLYLNDGTCLRIDADKFNFDVLGEAKQLTEHLNAEALLQRLRSQAPQAIVDTAFADFRCPPDIIRAHFSFAGHSSTTRTSDAPAFDFYSAWAANMYHHLLHRA